MRHRQQDIGANMALIALLVVACVTGLPPLADVVVKAFAQSKAEGKWACRICGVVEDVREVTLESAKYGTSSASDSGFALVFALLNGKLDDAPVKVYEVEVHLQDGSVRVIREGALPAWKPGDHVKVVMGQVRPVL